MKQLTKISIILMVLVTFGYTQTVDLNTLMQKSAESQKKIMIFFHIPGCPYCTTMLKENFQDETTLKHIENKLLFLDIYTAKKDTYKLGDFQGDGKALAKHLGAFAYPSTIFLDQEGKVIYKAIGYRNIDEYLPILQYITTNSYKTKDLETFLMDLELEEDEE